jgi:hypothetical protein
LCRGIDWDYCDVSLCFLAAAAAALPSAHCGNSAGPVIGRRIQSPPDQMQLFLFIKRGHCSIVGIIATPLALFLAAGRRGRRRHAPSSAAERALR